MLTYHELDTQEHNLVKFVLKHKHIYFKTIHSKVMSAKHRPFCSGHHILCSQCVHSIFRPQGVNSTVRARLAYGPHHCSQPIRFQSSKGLAVILVRTGKAHCPAASPVLSVGRQAGKCGALVLYFCIFISHGNIGLEFHNIFIWDDNSHISFVKIFVFVCAYTFSHGHTYLWNQHWFGLTHKLE